MTNDIKNLMTPSEAAKTESNNETVKGHVTVTANMASPGYPPYMFSVTDNKGRFITLEVTKEQLEVARFAQQNRFSVLVDSEAGGKDRPNKVTNIQVYT